MILRFLLLTALCLAPLSSLATAAEFLPAALTQLAKKHRVTTKGIGVVIRRVDDNVLLANHQADRFFNPASVIKIPTMLAAMDLLGPKHQWKTSIAAVSAVKDGVLAGDLYLIGGGDPYITAERFLYLLSILRQRGVHEIRGDLVLDDSVFMLPPHDASIFDGAGFKPYNVGAGGLIINFKAHRVVFVPDGGGVRVYSEPPNDNFVINSSKMQISNSRCRNNWRGHLRERLRDDGVRATLSLSGSYAKRCGERSFYLSVLDHPAYVAGVFASYWRQLGGVWNGNWRRGETPSQATVLVESESPPLPQVLMAMNKNSNNVIARNLFLSLSKEDDAHTPDGAQRAMQSWLRSKGVEGVVIENGSGLSRRARITPAQMAHLLGSIWHHAYRTELLASLPILGVDGTLQRRLRKTSLAGEGRLKTGSLANVNTLAGFFRDKKGRHVLMVFFSSNVSNHRVRNLQNDIIAWASSLP